jgi:hypothetical protein
LNLDESTQLYIVILPAYPYLVSSQC